MKNAVSKISLKGNLKETIEKAVDQIGGFKQFIKLRDRVFLKPNFNTTDPFPASTDFEFLKTVVELVYEFGAEEVFIGDRSTFALNGRNVMNTLGIFELEKIGPHTQVLVLDEHPYKKKTIPHSKFLKTAFIPEILDKVDKLILLPCLKTHSSAQFTGSLKLSVGFMKPITRIPLHLRHLQEKIAELNTIIHPDLIIMDGRKCFITGGPSNGEIREPNLILASDDRVALDVQGINVIQSFPGNTLSGINPRELPQIKRAIEMGL